jgi:hypothetical protein
VQRALTCLQRPVEGGGPWRVIHVRPHHHELSDGRGEHDTLASLSRQTNRHNVIATIIDDSMVSSTPKQVPRRKVFSSKALKETNACTVLSLYANIQSCSIMSIYFRQCASTRAPDSRAFAGLPSHLRVPTSYVPRNGYRR